MPSAPALSARRVNSMLSWVLSVPVLQTTFPRPFAASTTARNRSSFSLCESAGPSPVVPATTNASDPWSRRYFASSCAPSRSRRKSSLNGVTIAVITSPNLPAMVPPSLIASGHRYPSPVPRIYTKTGDDGTTGLLYGGRISKADLTAEAYGSVDEAVAAIGLARALGAADVPLAEELLRLQRELFVVGADLATNPEERHRLQAGVSLTTAGMVARLEELIDGLVAQHPLPGEFIVPGANPVSAALD